MSLDRDEEIAIKVLGQKEYMNGSELIEDEYMNARERHDMAHMGAVWFKKWDRSLCGLPYNYHDVEWLGSVEIHVYVTSKTPVSKINEFISQVKNFKGVMEAPVKLLAVVTMDNDYFKTHGIEIDG